MAETHGPGQCSAQTFGSGRQRVRRRGQPPSLRFVSVDFERQRLDERLRASGFRADRPAFFSWLGVTIYLTPEAVAGTLATIAACASG